jgi:hypothetical protein
MKPLFPLGQIVATPNALALLTKTGVTPLSLIHRHVIGDFGDVCDEDKRANLQALKDETRIFSGYLIGSEGDKIWVITEADRSVTTLLLPEDY